MSREDFRKMIVQHGKAAFIRMFAIRIEVIEARYREKLAKVERKDQAARVAKPSGKGDA
ncbi:hypothetical protein LH428_10245 [Laribacter hongkongensis]|uniref:hypothetical protein n=1 Tax=Laribacter hongkongensis TaxID=168471 RepID=UPI001EFEA826|nr:hypothetical protein [Laribacter hongkongensis]MCG9116224.1 hypothetical protein [Laribacter hongkongensis]